MLEEGESIFKTGDIFVSATGSKNESGQSFTGFSMFEYREDGDNGEGFRYSPSGISYGYFWAYPSKDSLFKDIPEEIFYSFKHGSHNFYVEDRRLKECKTIADIVSFSDIKIVTIDDVNIASVIEDIKDIEGIKINWGTISKHGITPLIAKLCLIELGAKIPPVINGEIGLHSYMLIEAFHANKEMIKEKLQIHDGCGKVNNECT